MYRDDEAARTERAKLLIDEIAGLEREKLAAAAADRRLEDAKRELAALQAAPSAPTLAPAEPAPRPPGLATHLVVGGRVDPRNSEPGGGGRELAQPGAAG